MDRNFPKALGLVLKHEGGYSDNPKDPGGPTNKGITLNTFRSYIKPSGTKDDLRALTVEQAGVVYRRQYWDTVLGARLPSGIDYMVFDFAVNSGPNRAAKYLQAIVRAPEDGKIGPATLKAVNGFIAAHGVNKLIERYCDDRLAFLKRLPTWPTFKNGWTARVIEVEAMAKSLASVPSTTITHEDATEVGFGGLIVLAVAAVAAAIGLIVRKIWRKK